MAYHRIYPETHFTLISHPCRFQLLSHSRRIVFCDRPFVECQVRNRGASIMNTHQAFTDSVCRSYAQEGFPLGIGPSGSDCVNEADSIINLAGQSRSKGRSRAA